MENVKTDLLLHIEVAYANEEKQCVREIQVPQNCTVQTAIHLSGILKNFPEINLQQQRIGIFSEFVELDTMLHDGDRVEIYRPLFIDPKQRRKLRAGKNKERAP